MNKIILFIVFILFTPLLLLPLDEPIKTGNQKIDDFSQKVYKLYYDIEEIETNLKNANVTMIWILSDPDEFKTEIQKVSSGEVDMDYIINQKITKLPKEITFSDSNFTNLLNLEYYEVLEKTINNVKDGIVDLPSKIVLIQNQIKELITIGGSLPNEAKSLGFKAPKAIKAIKANVEVLNELLKKIPNLITESENTVNIIASILSQKSLTITLNNKYIETENIEFESYTQKNQEIDTNNERNMSYSYNTKMKTSGEKSYFARNWYWYVGGAIVGGGITYALMSKDEKKSNNTAVINIEIPIP